MLNDPIKLIGPASLVGNSRETFHKSGTDGSNRVPSSGESIKPRRQMLQTRGVGSGKHPVNGARKALFTVDPGINNVIQIGNKIRALDPNAPGENGKSEQ